MRLFIICKFFILSVLCWFTLKIMRKSLAVDLDESPSSTEWLAYTNGRERLLFGHDMIYARWPRHDIESVDMSHFGAGGDGSASPPDAISSERWGSRSRRRGKDVVVRSGPAPARRVREIPPGRGSRRAGRMPWTRPALIAPIARCPRSRDRLASRSSKRITVWVRGTMQACSGVSRAGILSINDYS